MREAELLFARRLSQFLSWERAKRREKVFVSGLLYSILISMLLYPLKGFLHFSLDSLDLTPLFFLACAGGLFWAGRWQEKDSLKAVACLDRSLDGQDTVLTAWEIGNRHAGRPADLLVVEEAADRLRPVDFRSLLRRKRSWQLPALFPVLLLWLALAVLRPEAELAGTARSAQASIVQTLRELSRDLRSRPSFEKLVGSAAITRSIERIVNESQERRRDREQLPGRIRTLLGHIRGSTGSAGKPGHAVRSELKEGLAEVLEQLSKAKEALEKGEPRQARERLRRAATLSPVARAGTDRENTEGAQSEQEIRQFVQEQERMALAELDRLTVSEIREFLEDVLEELNGEAAPISRSELAGTEARSSPGPGESKEGAGLLPGGGRGEKGGRAEGFAPLPANLLSRLKGMVGEGKRSSLRLYGGSRDQQPKTTEEEVLVSYQRRAEEDLDSEKIPEGYREMIKRYFLSIGMNKR